MNEKTAGNLYNFLQYLAKAEIGPMLALPPQAVTFTLSEIETALRELEQNGEVYRQSRKTAFARLGVTFDLSEGDCALISTGSDAAHDFIRDRSLGASSGWRVKPTSPAVQCRAKEGSAPARI